MKGLARSVRAGLLNSDQDLRRVIILALLAKASAPAEPLQ